MPRVRPLTGTQARAADVRAEEDRIVERYGMRLSTGEMGRVIGLKNYNHIKQWAEAEGIRPIRVGQRDKWDSRDIARAICNAKLREA